MADVDAPAQSKTAPPEGEASDPGYRSRSQSRRARRRKQQENQKQKQKPETIEEDYGPESENAMQPFERIGPAETSMDGPVTYARAQRGEIPMRKGNPKQTLMTGPGQRGESELMKQDGLKLRLELNLDVEIEIKASIRGDLTLALLA